ncbi:FliI/YscN family ATPase [Sphingomonas sp. DT-204]
MKPHRFLAQLDLAEPAVSYGHITEISANHVKASGPSGHLGQLCEIEASCGEAAGLAQIVAVGEAGVTLVALDRSDGFRLGARVTAVPAAASLRAGDGFGARAIDALGQPIDGGGPIADAETAYGGQIAGPLDRLDPQRRLVTGIRAIDGLLTLGVGQRVGIFAASGVGKTSLIDQLARQVPCDRCVLCLVGERGREVSGLWETLAGTKERARVTMVAATSDQSPVLRVRAVEQALVIAEYWRARGEHVLLLLDSVTRLAMALREIGLAAGSPPTVRAYTPNVFAELPRLVERCGAVRGEGAITAIMTVLSETDDVDDPIVELMKSLLDGHILLSRTLAEQGHFPAIDILRSISRQAARLVDADQAEAMRDAVALLAAYDESRIMIESGVYRARSNPRVDRAIAAREPLGDFLRQSSGENSAWNATFDKLRGTIAHV